MYQKAKIRIGIVLLMLLVPLTAYAQDLNSELLDAAKQGDVATVKALLGKGADVNAKDNNDETALMLAAYNGHTEIVETLLAKGADVNAKNKDGLTALMYAADGGQQKARTVTYVWNVDSPYMQPIETPGTRVPKGHPGTVKMLLAKGADVNAKNDYSVTALMYAAAKGHTEIVETLITKGADVNMKNKDGLTALMYAADKGHTKTVEMLLAKGADVNMKNKDGLTALMYAAVEGQTEIAETLLAKGADVNAKDKHGLTALMYAAAGEQQGVRMLSYIWNVDPPYNMQPKGHPGTVKMLLAKGADVNAKTNDGDTALMFAALEGHTEIVRLLEQAGAKE